MTEQSVNYAKVLFSLNLGDDVIAQSKELLQSEELVSALSNPAVKKTEKESVINTLFPEAIRSYIKVLCFNECMELVNDIFAAYEEIKYKADNKIKATFYYVTKPEQQEIDNVKEMLKAKYNKKEAEVILEEDASLLGGFVLKIGDIEYDKSIKGTLKELQKNLVRR